MKNKGTYLLLAVVVVVWALIGYRFLKYLKQDAPDNTGQQTEDYNFQPQNFTQDTFSIVANYRDPFLGRSEPEKKPVAVVPKAVPRPIVIKNVKWPVIIFKGLIKNNESQKSYGLILIDGKMKSVVEKDEISDVKIIDIQRDSIGVLFNNETRYFHKSKNNESHKAQK